jgi:methyl-accepting chemotaxis protein
MDGVLERLSIRSKIAVILILPVLACAVLGVLRVNARISTSRQADRVTKLTEFSLLGTTVAHELEHERGLAARFLNGASGSSAQALQQQETASNRAMDDYRASVDKLDVKTLTATARDTLASALGHLDGLADLRHDIGERGVSAPGALDFYNATVADLLNSNRELATRIADPELSQAVGAFVSVSRIKELAALERELVSGVLANGTFGAGEYRRLTSTLATRGVLLSEFQATATPAQRDLFVRTVVGPEAQRAKELQAEVVATEGTGKLAVDPDQWFAVSTAEIDLLHQVEQQLGTSAVNRSRSIERSANSRAAADSLAVLGVLALAVGLSLLVARSMLRSLRLLQASAKDVAQNRLPGVVAKLQHSTGEAPDLSHELEPVKVPSRDEIGEVAAAFNTVNQVAVRVAAEQAALRMSIGDIFLNLARRSQALIDRQLELIDDLEEEADSQMLASLFQLDHLATRMRRNAENLIVLSGAEPARRWTEPIPLGDVARGAIAEVEDYQRVALVPMDEVGVPGHAGADIIHLLSELIENATSFSPPGTVVRVGGQMAATGYTMEVEDRGLGMSDEEMIEANERLANPPTIDFAVSRMLGLFVVGRLARRYNIRVQLRHSSYGGVTALVMLPSSVVLPLGPQPAGSLPPNDPFVAPQLVGPEPAMAESLPIFEQARSDWFEVGAPGSGSPTPPAYPPLAARFSTPEEPPQPPASRPREYRESFQVPMPEGPPFPDSRAFPDPGGFPEWDEEPPPAPPATGLPRRVPRANLAPGILAQRERAMREELDEARRQARSPEEVRSLLESYRAGIERGRRGAGYPIDGTAGWDADATVGNEHDEPG